MNMSWISSAPIVIRKFCISQILIYVGGSVQLSVVMVLYALYGISILTTVFAGALAFFPLVELSHKQHVSTPLDECSASWGLLAPNPSVFSGIDNQAIPHREIALLS